jgi:hypothetical protein
MRMNQSKRQQLFQRQPLGKPAQLLKVLGTALLRSAG